MTYVPEEIFRKRHCYLKKAGNAKRKGDRHSHYAELPCKDLWTSCPPGEKLGSDYKSCICPDNTRREGKLTCLKCPAGKRTFHDTNGEKMNECIPCLAGQFGASAGAGCSTCPANTYSGRTGATSCTPCPAGKFSLSGANSCPPCPPGQYGSSSGAGCFLCPSNTYSSVSIFLELDVLCVQPTLTAQ